jgi:hypothetical protein
MKPLIQRIAKLQLLIDQSDQCLNQLVENCNLRVLQELDSTAILAWREGITVMSPSVHCNFSVDGKVGERNQQ